MSLFDSLPDLPAGWEWRRMSSAVWQTDGKVSVDLGRDLDFTVEVSGPSGDDDETTLTVYLPLGVMLALLERNKVKL